MKVIFLFSTLLILSCNSTRSATDLNCTHPSGWCDEIIDTATEAYLYAQMATNTYGDSVFTLPSHIKLIQAKDNDRIGFAYSIYENINSNQKIISFRGTENFRDWWYGNLLKRQNRSGLALFDSVRSSLADSSNIIVTGHSLGGAIALEISLKRKFADTYVFNTSPRFSKNGHSIQNKRISIVEHGEILKALRAPASEATQTYTSIGCSSGGFISQHEQAKLAVCLTRIAALESEQAKLSLKENKLDQIFTEKND